jgi:hypothetical protein
MNPITLRAGTFCLLFAVAPSVTALNYTAVVLHPTGYDASEGVGASTQGQVGFATSAATNNKQHAIYWNGSAASAIDLNPAGFAISTANGASGNRQVGTGYATNAPFQYRALMWQGTAASAVDLNPTGFDGTQAFGVAGARQVGYGYGTATFNRSHAIVWRGTAESVVDLHPFVSAVNPNFIHSEATGIADDGTIVGYAIGSNFIHYAVEWKPNPDFNQNGTVDLADYVLWRKGLNTNYDESDYNLWRTHFGQTSPASSAGLDSQTAAVPEPASFALFTCGFFMTLLASGRRVPLLTR